VAYADGAFSAAPFTLRLEVLQYSQDIATNTSVVVWTLRIYKNGNYGYYTTNSYPWAVNINGTGYSGTFSFDFGSGPGPTIPIGGYIQIASGSTAIAHNADGTKSFSFSSSATTSGATLGNASNAGSMGLTTIPRASTPTYSDSTPDAGTSVTITTNRASSGFTHTIEDRWQGSGSAYSTIATGVGASTSWALDMALCNDIPNATSRVREIKTTTYNGATLIGTSITTVAVQVPASVVPDFGTVTHDEATVTPDVDALIGAYVQGVTTLAVAITSPVGAYSSTIASQKIEVVGQPAATVNAGSGTTPVPISASGTVTLRGTVTDSRGRTHSEDVTITVLAYAIPTLAAWGVQRSLADGTPDDEGTYIRVDIDASASSLIVSAVQKNEITYRISTSPRDADTWTVKATVGAGAVVFDDHDEVGTYSVDDAFDVRLEIMDELVLLPPFQASIATAAVFIHLGHAGEGIGVGKYWEQGGVDSLLRMYQRDGLEVMDEDDLAEVVAGLVALAPANKVINGEGRVNQRAAASGTSLASGAYFLDRWRSTAATNAVTWSGSDDTGRVMTVPASKSIATTLERRDLPAGDYILGHAGTAQGRVYNVGATPPSYAAMPVTVTLDGSADVVVEFSAGTVSEVQLVPGSTLPEFTRRPYAAELALCQRYHFRLVGSATDVRVAMGVQASTTLADVLISFPVPMRTTPAVTILGTLRWTDAVGFNAAVSSINTSGFFLQAGNVMAFRITYAAAGAQFRPGFLSAAAANSGLIFDAEL